MLKTIFLSIGKVVGYFLILFVWFRLAAPFLISYPSNTLVVVGIVGSIVFTLLWTYFFIKTMQKIISKFK